MSVENSVLTRSLLVRTEPRVAYCVRPAGIVKLAAPWATDARWATLLTVQGPPWLAVPQPPLTVRAKVSDAVVGVTVVPEEPPAGAGRGLLVAGAVSRATEIDDHGPLAFLRSARTWTR